MPAPNDGQLVAAAWEDYVKQDPTDQIFDRYWLLENLRPTMRKGAGDPITGSIEYAINTTVKAMSELETLDVNRVDVFDRYEFPWKFVGGDIVMSEFERGVTAGGAGKFDLYAGKIDNLKRSFENKINADLFSDGSGTSGKQAGGLQLVVAANPLTGTAGGINRAVFSFWRNIQVSGAKTSTAFDNLRASMRSAYNQQSNGIGQDTPDFGVTDRVTFEGLESQFLPLERYNRTSTSDKAISGFKGTHIINKDVPIAYDNDCPAGYMYQLNKRNLFIRYMYWMKAYPPGTPVNQFIDVVKILTVYNLITDNPRRLSVVTGIT